MVRKVVLNESLGDKLSQALAQRTDKSGASAGTSVFHAEDGTKTVLGEATGAAGIVPFVGDTTPPGKPTGLTLSTKPGVVIVTWDGTLEGGIPADFARVIVFAQGGAGAVSPAGELTVAGSLVIDGFPAGTSVTVTAAAEDNAHAEDLTPAPNRSAVVTVGTVTVSSVVAQADIDAMNQRLADAAAELDQAQTDITTAKTGAQNALDQLAGEAQSALGDQAAAAKTAADAAVTQTVQQYAQSDSAATAPTSGWSDTAPTWTAGKYIWVRTVITYGSGATTTTDPVVVTGNPGSAGPVGPKGDTGSAGPKGDTGAAGKSSYTHIAYADTAAGGGFSQDPAGKAYMGVYVDEVLADSSDPSKYAWSLIKGLDGAQGAPGPKGADGRTPYFHTAWADSADGKTNFSTTTPGDRSYLGTYTDYTQADSTAPADYVWAKIEGPQGPKGDRGADGIAGKDGVGITGTVLAYAKSTSGTTPPATGWGTSVPSSTPGQYLWTRTTWTYSDGSSEQGYSVSMWGATGPKGDTGNDGIAGKDGVGITDTVITYAGSASGTTPPSSGWSTSIPTVAAGDFLWTRTVWSYTDGTTEQGYSAAKMGAQGATGVSVTSVVRYYQQGTSTSKPAKPTTATPSGWSTTEPGYAAGKTLYYTDKVTYSSGSFSFSDVQTSSAYLAAAAAREAADAAQAQADAALAASQDFIKDPQFKTGADNVKGMTINATDANAGTLPGTATTYGLLTGNDNWTLNTLITTVPGHVYEWSVWAKVASNNTRTGKEFGVMVWRLTADGNPAQSYDRLTGCFDETMLAEWTQVTWRWTAPSDGSWPYVRPSLRAGGYNVLVTDWHVRDVTSVKALEDAAAAAQQAATAAKLTADGKNKILAATTQPSSAGLVAGDLWLVLNSSGNVTNIKVWNGTAFVDYVLLASSILVPGSVGAVQIANGAVNADKVTASVALLNKILVRKLVGGDIDANTITATNLQANEAMLVKLLVRKLKADELEVGQIAAAIIKSGSFQATDGEGNVTVSIDGATGKLTAKEAAITGTLQTGEDGNRVVVSTQEITYPGEEAGPVQEVGAVSFCSGKTGEKAATVSSVTTSDVTGGKYLLHLTGGAPSEAAWTALSTKPELLISTAGSSDGSVAVSEAVLCGDQVYLGSHGTGELDGVVIDSGNGIIFAEGESRYRMFTANGDYVWSGTSWKRPRVLLFDNDNASFTGATILSETAANFVALDILYKTNDAEYASVRVYRPNGKKVSLAASRIAPPRDLWMKARTVIISDTTIDTVNDGGWLAGEVNASASGQYNIPKDVVAITQVIGYRNLDAL